MQQIIVIALPLEDNQLSPLHEWGKRFNFSGVTEVHFVHIVKKNITPLEFGMVESPDESTYKDMVPALTTFLKDEARKILPTDFTGKTQYRVTKDFNPEDEFIDILKEVRATLTVVATRGKHGIASLFSTSFTEHMVKYSPCDIYVVRTPEDATETP